MKQYALVKAISTSGISFQNEPPDNIQWAPPGKHKISATRGDEPVKMTVEVTAEAVDPLNRSLEKIRAEGYKPYIDFNHEDKEASGWIDSYYWGGDDPTTGGIRAKVQWSEEGAAKLKGKSFDRFSPTFLVSTKGRIIGTTANTGGLVNRPAFTKIASVMQAKDASDNHLLFVSASDQPEDESTNKPKPKTPQKSMTDEEKKKMQDLEAENKELKTKVQALEDDNKKMKAKAKEAEVTALVQGAIKDGKIMAKDEAQVKSITAMANADLDNTKAFIETMPSVVDASEGLFKRITPNQGKETPVKAEDKQTQMENAIAEIKAKNPEISGEAAFELAAKANPELFAVNA